AADLHAETVETRRYLHMHPELSFEEYNTSAFVAGKLTELGIPFEKKANTGLVALLKGEKPGPDKVIALRADMDALPILEANHVGCRSTSGAVMHGSGQDVQAACGLGTAGTLSER